MLSLLFFLSFPVSVLKKKKVSGVATNITLIIVLLH